MLHETGTLAVILGLQASYVAIALLFSAVGMYVKLTPRSPWFGFLAMLLHGILVGLKVFYPQSSYYVPTMVVCIIAITKFDMVSHFHARSKTNLTGYAGAGAWNMAVWINIAGVSLAIGGVLASFNVGVGWLCGVFALFLTFAYLSYTKAVAAGIAAARAVSDCSWLDPPYEVPTGQKWRFKSQYITMPDGKKLACDVYLPKEGGRYPTMLHFTRYNRNWGLSRSLLNPVKLLMSADGVSFNMRSLRYAERFVPCGYAWVTVDVRGTGASGGSRPIDFSPQEIQDYQTVLHWVLDQEFCDGQIGSCGISYDGMASLFLASSNHPAVKAVAPVCFPYDVYEEMCAPGGIACTGSVVDYSKFVRALEGGDLTLVKGVIPDAMFTLLTRFLSGVLPVQGEEDQLLSAVRDHSENWDMTTLFDKATGKDAVVLSLDGNDMRARDFGVSAVIDRITANKALAVYTVGAWYDAGAVGGAFKFHEKLSAAGLQSKLTVGPWTHGCRKNCSPNALDDHVPKFDLYAELVRFFDWHLKRRPGTRIDTEPPVHVWALGSERWVGAASWPPSRTSVQRLALAPKRELLATRSSKSAAETQSPHSEWPADEWAPDYTASSGRVSRWNYVQHIALQAVTYPDRRQQASRCLVYASPPLAADVVVSGSAIAELHLELDAADAAVFVYLEEETSDGAVRYVTEGQLLAAHRARPTKFLCSDLQPMPVATGPNEDSAERLDVVLQPISYCFRRGSRIRLALAAADEDNFVLHDDPRLGHWQLFPDHLQLENLPKRASKWWLHRSRAAPSALHLPVEGASLEFQQESFVAQN